MAVPETSQSPPAGLTEMEMAFLCEQLDNHGDKPLFRDTGLPGGQDCDAKEKRHKVTSSLPVGSETPAEGRDLNKS